MVYGISLLAIAFARSNFASGALVVYPGLIRIVSVIPNVYWFSFLHLLAFSIFDPPMGDNVDGDVDRPGCNPTRSTALALRGIKNALLQGDTLEVALGDVTARVIDGLGQHSDTSQKGSILSVKVIHPGNVETRKSHQMVIDLRLLGVMQTTL